ncbi:MSHA pilin protein MshA [Rheinheimera pacifica]|uniref:prepilin-type N-terminal cleavage/methylation domain-containing protein n=1 Tax=Rheinheimera pacifica TaxID=173990 RepID=UPI002863317C|nr:prepilin-type N-terminal cleavage/methylation domain-containing protein [Rheinheimera pacifica]MDR6984218.1 MSHA pilin protein MshA [Rheinheimera pacifica]
MKRNQGFTLIELIIVIVILGILAVTAAPRFLNLTGDARGSTLEAVRASIQSAAAIVNGKALIQGQQNANPGQVTDPAGNIATVFGFPAATAANIQLVLDLDAADWVFTDSASAAPTPAGVVAISPNGIAYNATPANACQVLYTQPANSGDRPTFTVQPEGCR